MGARSIRPVSLQFLFVFVVLLFAWGVSSALWERTAFEFADENLDSLQTSRWLFAAAGAAGAMLPGVLAWFIVGIAASMVMHVRVSPHMWVYALICDAVTILPVTPLVWDGDALWTVSVFHWMGRSGGGGGMLVGSQNSAMGKGCASSLPLARLAFQAIVVRRSIAAQCSSGAGQN